MRPLRVNLRRREASDLLAALNDARRVELEIFDAIPDSQLLGRQAHFLEPPIWEIGHVGWFQEYWILRHLDGAEPHFTRAFTRAMGISPGAWRRIRQS